MSKQRCAGPAPACALAAGVTDFSPRRRAHVRPEGRLGASHSGSFSCNKNHICQWIGGSVISIALGRINPRRVANFVFIESLLGRCGWQSVVLLPVGK